MGIDSHASLLSLCLIAGCAGGDLTLPSDATPAALTIVKGDGQSAQVGAALPDPLVVRLADAQGRPVAGAQVGFEFVGDLPGASVDPGTAPTDETGQAAVQAQLGRREGPQIIEATVPAPGADLRVRFNLTALARTGGNGGQGGDPGGDPGVDPGGNSGGGPGSVAPPPGGDVGGGGGGNEGGKAGGKDGKDGKGKGGKGKGRG